MTELPPGERPNRRATDRGPLDSPLARRRRLVVHISNDPDLTAWLGVTKARTLHEVAAELTRAGFADAAEIVSRRARDLASGDASPF